MRALLLGLSILGTTAPKDSSVHFARVYAPGEVETHKFSLVAEKVKLGIEDTVQITVKQMGSDTTPTSVVIESLDHRAVSGDAGPKPETLNTTLGRHNMPKGLSMTGGNYIFLLGALAAFTPDKDVDVGDSYVIEYGNPKESIKIHGRGKITRISEKGGTIAAHIVASISLDDQPLAKATFDSVYNLKNGALVTTSGTFGIPKLTYVVVINPH